MGVPNHATGRAKGLKAGIAIFQQTSKFIVERGLNDRATDDFEY
jgi:hypothetical protein